MRLKQQLDKLQIENEECSKELEKTTMTLIAREKEIRALRDLLVKSGMSPPDPSTFEN